MRRAPIVLALILLAACGPPPRAGGRRPTPRPLSTCPTSPGDACSLASLKGKVVVLDFWATWCGPCIVEMPEYNEFARKNRPRGVEVIGVVFDSGEPQEIQDFVREHRDRLPPAPRGRRRCRRPSAATMGFPTTFVIDGEGIIRTKILGSPPDKFERLQKAVDAALVAAIEVTRVSVTREQVLDALRTIQDPDLHKDIVTLGFVKDVDDRRRRPWTSRSS